MEPTQRRLRKLEHIKYAIEFGDGPVSTFFDDVTFIPECLPELDPADIFLPVEIFGKQLRMPLLIDALTGGFAEATALNRSLAAIAAKFGLGLAVGSQSGVIKQQAEAESFEIIRDTCPDGLILANISTLATPEEAQAAVTMVSADALEIHLNVAQELMMPEGDKNFAGILAKLERIREKIKVPIVIKETGCGIAAEQYLRLKEAGFKIFNCAGAGGTNFLRIEAARSGNSFAKGLETWGLPTTWSLLDASVTLTTYDVLIASGGVRRADEIAKAFALGADIVAMAGNVLRLLLTEGEEAVCAYFAQLEAELRCYLLLCGCSNPKSLRSRPLVIRGATKEFIECRGYDLQKICQQRR